MGSKKRIQLTEILTINKEKGRFVNVLILDI